ncbi:helix-turn-helix transcriptional regulator [Lysinibacillus capsici]|uniref:helix-turn-helix transcriptional regulator n=1 Tax=Lysinibacillus capsici TaxID=2115968 RepID=UPI00325F9AF3
MINNILKYIREERGMSKSELSRRSGISRITITKIEANITNPKATTISSICKVLNKNPSEIFFTQDVNHELQRWEVHDFNDSRTGTSEY